MRWLAAREPLDVFTTAITEAELLYRIEILPGGKRRNALQTAIEKVFAEEFRGRVLPFDEDAAGAFAKIVAGRDALRRPISQFDAMIAAIARSRRMAVATRNMGDFEHCGRRVVNPWSD